MESALLRLEQGAADSETLNEIFRSAHTIKGSAGLFGLHDIVGFTHFVENVLDKARSGSIVIDTNLQGVLLHCKDHMLKLLDSVRSGSEMTQAMVDNGDALLQELQPWLNPDALPAAAAEEHSAKENSEAGSGAWHISLRLSPDVLQNGMDPLSFLRFLSGIGEITQLVTLDDGLPDSVDDFDAEILYLGFEIDLATDQDRVAIEEAFCLLRMVPIFAFYHPVPKSANTSN
jgi:two-component system chemotaxis sensor kinase CheA